MANGASISSSCPNITISVLTPPSSMSLDCLVSPNVGLAGP
jgi:hypothetical protein